MNQVYSVEIDDALSSCDFYVRIRKPAVFEMRVINFTISSTYSKDYLIWVSVLHLISVFQNELDQLV